MVPPRKSYGWPRCRCRFAREELFLWGRRGVGGGGVEFLFQVVQFFAQVAVSLLEVEDFLAQVFEIIHGLAAGAEFGDAPLGGGLLRGAFGGGGEGLERGNGLGIAQSAERIDGGQFNGSFFVVQVPQKELANGVLFFLAPGQVSERLEGLGKSGGGKIGLPFGESVQEGRQEGGVVLQPHCSDGGIGQLVAIGVGIEELDQELAGLG